LIYLVDKHKLLELFGVDDFNLLEDSISNTPPSMSEYYFNDIISYCEDSIYLNKSNIQDTIYIDNFNLYLDYDLNIYLESLKCDEYETQSLW